MEQVIFPGYNMGVSNWYDMWQVALNTGDPIKLADDHVQLLFPIQQIFPPNVWN
jgi:hypothetical protein